MKLKNNGFAISVVLYGLLVLFLMVKALFVSSLIKMFWGKKVLFERINNKKS